MSVIRDKPTNITITTLTTVWVWNSNRLFLAATIPISSKFRCSPSWGCQQFCICCRHMSVITDKPTIITTLTTVWVWNSNILLLAAPIPISSKFRCSPGWGCQQFCICCRHMSVIRDKPTIHTISQQLKYGIVMYFLSLNPFLSNSNFVAPLAEGVNNFAFVVGIWT